MVRKWADYRDFGENVTMTHDEIVAEALKGFDCEKVHKAMTAVGWTWFWCGVPSPEQVREQADSMIRELLSQPDNIISHGGGGLYARRRRDGDFKVKAIRIEFVLEEVEVTLWDEPLEPLPKESTGEQNATDNA